MCELSGKAICRPWRWLYSMIKNASKLEEIEEALSIRLYKEAINLLLDQRKTQKKS